MNEGINFKDLGVWASEQSPVFILGPERSGTSMMFRALVSHSSFCQFGNATVETFAFVQPEKLLAEPSPDNYEIRLYLGKKYEKFVRSVDCLNNANVKNSVTTLPIGYVGDKYKDQQVWEQRGYCNLLRAFFYFSWLNLGRKRLAEKTPAHVRHLDHILECFPNARILVCLRSPQEIIASHRKRLANELSLGKSERDPSLLWLQKSVNEYINYFVSVERNVREAEKLSNNVLRISYSKVTQSSEYLDSVFNFLGEDSNKVRVDGSMSGDSALKWDPLLNASPQTNIINVSDYLTDIEIEKCTKLSAANNLNWS